MMPDSRHNKYLLIGIVGKDQLKLTGNISWQAYLNGDGVIDISFVIS